MAVAQMRETAKPVFIHMAWAAAHWSQPDWNIDLTRQKAPGLLQVPSPLSNDMNQVDGDVGGCIVADAGHWSLSKLGAWLHTVVAGCLIKMSLIP